ncbi:type IV-A pilus assembly ATPase PilB [Reinekea blandensis]|uniref:Type 4 fimbrial biogenesis protein PilB n=1 Tax=Reinekea blandensis MED297 TaxID=314283 RepID=A4BKF5_9GAMM|nr:type IV-A pilus assembly ATPase PilB [Reinekea blandensis]EAR07402.1 type 4 fimbrial biogenesis protein PilB [Reinekea sp. MED297] [Reinekea blandensis MED297]
MSLGGLARRMVSEGLLSEDEALTATKESSREKRGLVPYLVENDLVNSTKIAMLAADEFGSPIFDLDAYDFEQYPRDLIANNLILAHHAIPLIKRGTRLFVAVSDPTNLIAIDEIKFHTGLSIESVLVDESKLQSAIEKVTDDASDAFDDLDDEGLDDLDVVDTKSKDDEDTVADGSDDAPVVRFINQMLLNAIKKGASDLHFEPYEKTYRVRFRIDGVLQNVAKPPIGLGPKMAARLKVMSNLDISERRVPQDGRIKLKISKNKAIDFRVNTLPTLFGEKIVMRILDPSSAKMGIDALGYEEEQKDMYLTALEKPQGMILVTGPTGSGKTVSLYTGLNILNREGINISTAEDPVEINLEGINQVNVNNKVGLDFAAALRSFLRQDPDIIMVGEIRDLETASIAIKAAQTGHMVMSTLHTNSAGETLTRMLNMGVPAFNLATTVNLIIAQRLARRLCSKCKAPAEIPLDVLEKEGFSPELAKTATLYTPVGCDSCNKGYKGRVGIYEVVRITPAVSRIIMEEGNSIQLNEQFAKEGFNSLRKSGLVKAASGVTSLEEVNRVTTD